MKRLFLKVEGIVQGVGFRPFVYNQALSLNLKGWINNNSQGVTIDVEGEEEKLNILIDRIRYKSPPLASVGKVVVEERKVVKYDRFEIRESERENSKVTLISPDRAVCKECIEEISNPSDKRYRYPFNSCTNCGPRFSIIKSTPYDREGTTVKKFNMCKDCNEEYNDPADRRFHAQTNLCKECGPHIWIEDSTEKKMEVEDVIHWTIQKLKQGKIFAIKGLGGFNLVCDAAKEDAVNLLRIRKKRPDKPFAVMLRDIGIVKKYCNVNEQEDKILKGCIKPIVILDQKSQCDLPKSIAPYQKTLGVVLPYTPLHHLLFHEGIEALIMTSGNSYGMPLEYRNESAVEKLGDVADYFLHHNRDIHVPIDDSVVKVVDGEIRMIRRARGYVPEPIKKDNIREILAYGSNMKNTFCIAKENFIFLSQHNGNLDNLETIEYYENNIEHFKSIFNFTPKYIACDMHPNYISSEYAYRSCLPRIEVQHHHAHIVSCLAENNVNGKVIGIAYDGTGYGIDGKLWGGEFLICDNREFTRMGHLNYVKMPGGERAVKEPWRMAVSHTYKAFKSNNGNEHSTEQLKEVLIKLYGNKAMNLMAMMEADINCPETSSMGRFFDAAASLIGLRNSVTYEGQAAIELEAAAAEESLDFYHYDIVQENGYIVDTKKIIMEIIKDKLSGEQKGIISDKFHNTIIKFSKDICRLIREDTGIDEVALSGGVFQNSYLLKNLRDELENENFVVYTNKLIPANDGGVSLGQIVIANEVLSDI
ncbi:carbamoyltransferase HypF [Clostridium pasteurianum DSM 525 = ATCC 6013]|uniref:Carbamoyltransferase n=1 Tax=Clostridium pasteurianum DSM 525 = ATCC 6013 TaxID=1262449 RepID=A0A0H3IZ67_CLOPA|nr:carbamoyltransferase HypF [Clostridium pasteurianum]AJA46816.1 carbamoyltransferase HypF [Clostridium pasteurianum DSM 525 = ATCC 6013]AJA50804.1 carbamoyltransferase HypF [Clostridium pasteurianum DSM 525 = ATCC 6013]AOZ74210.1 hydrogenase maturation protein [Clostridium pasteurianum DSM 525 = ATCC 6013]AOZ78008.1 hydrogenase maturation protein [Clostridium pasteurianum]ELP58573.1 Hydrogenase maturation factor (hypF) [Clostridium pasteurianum DSM 525 = ATCC 6013]